MAPKMAGSRPKAPAGPWGVAGLPSRAVLSHHIRLPTPSSFSSWGGTPLRMSRFIPPRPQPRPSLPTMQLLRPKQTAPPTQSRSSPQVDQVAPPLMHQDPPRSSLAPTGQCDSDSDAPLVVGRKDVPKISQYSRGSAARADDIGKDKAAIKRLVRAKVAKSSIGTFRTRAAWWPSRALARKIPPFPLTPNKVRLAAALLKQAGYRSATGYLSGAKRRHIELGHPWDDQLALEFADCCRAVRRGLGPPKGAAPFDLDAVVALSPVQRGELQKSLVVPDAVNLV